MAPWRHGGIFQALTHRSLNSDTQRPERSKGLLRGAANRLLCQMRGCAFTEDYSFYEGAQGEMEALDAAEEPAAARSPAARKSGGFGVSSFKKEAAPRKAASPWPSFAKGNIIEESPNIGGTVNSDFILGMGKADEHTIILSETGKILLREDVTRLFGAAMDGELEEDDLGVV